MRLRRGIQKSDLEILMVQTLSGSESPFGIPMQHADEELRSMGVDSPEDIGQSGVRVSLELLVIQT